jgi:acyl-coenzyme A synthetase/AMP-(fatty) acid ligase
MNTPLSRIRRAWANPEDPASRNRHLWSREAGIRICDLAAGTSLGGRARELAGQSVLLVAHDQLAAALALIELDGVADRIIVCPPDIGSEHMSSIIETGSVNAIVSDERAPEISGIGQMPHIVCNPFLVPIGVEPDSQRTTEWVLLSSGTSSGVPKLVVHNLASLIAPIRSSPDPGPGIVWATFYDIRRYGGLQIFLRAILGKGSMVLSSAGESVAEHLARLQQRAVTHLSGTPSHWRRLLMSASAGAIAPRYVRLSGEIADQSILDMLRSAYPESVVGHAFASTEAGVAFEVSDGSAGFPVDLLGRRGSVEMKIVDQSLRIRSDRTALRYLGYGTGEIADEEGFVDTGDIVERGGERYHFLGRRNGVVNVGGMKVHPEEIEAVINSHPRVAISVVKPRRNPILGAVVSAEVVLKPEQSGRPSAVGKIEDEILNLCRQVLPPHKVPATLRLVSALDIAEAGKIVRHNA